MGAIYALPPGKGSAKAPPCARDLPQARHMPWLRAGAPGGICLFRRRAPV